MAQAKAMAALAPFVALAKSATSPRFAADLVARAIAHPGTYVFAELLQTPQVQALGGPGVEPQYAAYLTLLQIFSYGTYADYARGAAPSPHSEDAADDTQPPPPPPSSSSSHPLPPLTDVQAAKLRQLSLLSLATDRASLAYDHLVRALYLASARDLEALVTAAVYAGLVAATLDPAHQVVRVSSVAPLRDLAPRGTIPRLHAALRAWAGRCEATLADLDAQVAEVRRQAAQRAAEKRAWDARFQRAVDRETSAALGGGGGGGGDAATGMAASSGAGGSTLGAKPMTLNTTSSSSAAQQRLNKRGSNRMADPSSGSSAAGDAAAGAAGALDDEGAMDVDDDEDDDDDDEEGGAAGTANRRNRRKV